MSEIRVAIAGVVIDVIRAVKIALDRGIAGPLISMSAYAFKHPPIQVGSITEHEHEYHSDFPPFFGYQTIWLKGAILR